MIATADAIDLADRKGRARAYMFLLFATLNVAVMVADMAVLRTDFVHGLWVGMTTASSVMLLPLRWLKRRSAVARLLEDETAREHRRAAAAAGFWAGLVVAVVLGFVTGDGGGPAAFDVARLITTAALSTALVGFAALELRAARG